MAKKKVNSLGELMAHLSQLPKGKDTGEEKNVRDLRGRSFCTRIRKQYRIMKLYRIYDSLGSLGHR